MEIVFMLAGLLALLSGCSRANPIVMDPKISIPETDPISDGMRVRGTISEDVTLTCYVEDYPTDIKVRWQRTTFKDNFEELMTIPISSDKDSEDINKWSIEEPYDKTWKLRIKALQISDEGNYTCYMELTTETRIYANRTVLVTAPPLIIEAQTSSDTTAREGETLQLSCNATGRPVPTIYWRREGDALLPGGGVVGISPTLNIENLEYIHQGRYFCDAINEVGEVSRDVTLIVQYSPKLSPENVDGFGQAVGYKKTLVCLVDANPKPSYDTDQTQLVWMKGSSALVPDGVRTYTRVIQGAYNRLTFELVINDVLSSDFGTYTCRASNNLGSGDLEVTLYETDTPQPDKGVITSDASYKIPHLCYISLLLFLAVL